MVSDRATALRRYSIAGLAASLITVAILFVMTELTSPVGGDPVVRQMLHELELRQRDRERDSSGVRVFRLPAADEPPDEVDETSAGPARPQRPARVQVDEEPEQSERSEIIDWWATARNVIKNQGDAEFERWLEDQGYRKYVSIMQGAMPSSSASDEPEPEDAAGSAYRNTYGDVEVRINDNCVMQIRPRSFDSSNFAQNIPPLVVCKSSPKDDLSGIGKYRHR